MSTFKKILFVFIMIGSAWALWPEAVEKPGSSGLGSRPNPEGLDLSAKRHIIRVAPYNYLPGLKPMNIGKPVEALIGVAERFEALYPDTYIEFVGVPSTVREWLVTQLSAGQAPDILQVNVEDVWQDVQKGWYIPLDEYLERPNPFVPSGAPGSRQWWDLFKYQAISRGKAAPDGRMYCISYDMVETWIFYNKTIFAELGLSVPEDWHEFMEIQKRLQDADYMPILVSIISIADWGVDLIFDQLYYDLLPGIDLKQDPKREEYMQGYLDWDEICFLHQKGFFTRRDPRFVDLWRLLKEWRQYLPQDMGSLTGGSLDVLRLFITQRGAMIWYTSELVHLLANDPDIDFEWGVFYLPPIPPTYTEYAGGHPMCVIGGSAVQFCVSNSSIRDTGDPETSERLQRVVAFLQFMTAPESADAVVNELMCFLPNTVGVEPHHELAPFDEFLRRRYTTTKWTFTFDLKYYEILIRTLQLYLNDGISEDEFLDWTDRSLDSAVSTIIRRKDLDFSEFERRWRELEPVRRSMKGLPHVDG